jgi:ElaA protein
MTTDSRDEAASRSDRREPLPWPMDLREAVLVGDILGISPPVCRSRWSLLDPGTAHGLARLRLDVLVVEAARAQPELDNLDVVPTTEHLWVPDGETPVAYVRVVRDDGGTAMIDRACARADVRRLGLVSALIMDVLARRGAGVVRALAPPGTITFYARHGFEVCGSPAEVDGVRVTPMLRHAEVPWRD